MSHEEPFSPWAELSVCVARLANNLSCKRGRFIRIFLQKNPKTFSKIYTNLFTCAGDFFVVSRSRAEKSCWCLQPRYCPPAPSVLAARRSGWRLPPSAGNSRHWPRPSLDVKNRTANFPWRKHPHCEERALILPQPVPSLRSPPAAPAVRSTRGNASETRRETVLG